MINKKLAGWGLMLFAGSMLFFASCKKKDDPTNQPKTLTKSFLYDKPWWNTGSTIKHIFNSNGKYGSSGPGTWKWLNNADSMEVFDGSNTIVWYFEYNTEHEFSAKPEKSSGYILFKDAQW